jgi:hypothetical protein
MHKKRPRYFVSQIAVVLWMNAGSAKIRDGAAGIHSGTLEARYNSLNERFALKSPTENRFELPACQKRSQYLLEATLGRAKIMEGNSSRSLNTCDACASRFLAHRGLAEGLAPHKAHTSYRLKPLWHMYRIL